MRSNRAPPPLPSCPPPALPPRQFQRNGMNGYGHSSQSASIQWSPEVQRESKYGQGGADVSESDDEEDVPPPPPRRNRSRKPRSAPRAAVRIVEPEPEPDQASTWAQALGAPAPVCASAKKKKKKRKEQSLTGPAEFTGENIWDNVGSTFSSPGNSPYPTDQPAPLPKGRVPSALNTNFYDNMGPSNTSPPSFQSPYPIDNSPSFRSPYNNTPGPSPSFKSPYDQHRGPPQSNPYAQMPGPPPTKPIFGSVAPGHAVGGSGAGQPWSSGGAPSYQSKESWKPNFGSAPPAESNRPSWAHASIPTFQPGERYQSQAHGRKTTTTSWLGGMFGLGGNNNNPNPNVYDDGAYNYQYKRPGVNSVSLPSAMKNAGIKGGGGGAYNPKMTHRFEGAQE